MYKRGVGACLDERGGKLEEAERERQHKKGDPSLAFYIDGRAGPVETAEKEKLKAHYSLFAGSVRL